MQPSLRPLRFITFSRHPVIALAEKRGMLAEKGIALTTDITPSSTEQMRGLAQGRWDIAGTAFDNVLAWSGREGTEIVAVAQASEGVMLPVYARPEVRDWDDLRGKPLAADAMDTAYALVLRRILLAHGLDFDKGDYGLLPKGNTRSRLESMQRGETFAAVINPPLDKEAEAAGFVRLGDHREVLPDYPGSVLAVARPWAVENRPLLITFLQVLQQSLAWARDPANLAEARELLGESSRGIDRLPATLRPNMDGLRVALDLRVGFGMTPALGSDLARYVDPSYLEANQA